MLCTATSRIMVPTRGASPSLPNLAAPFTILNRLLPMEHLAQGGMDNTPQNTNTHLTITMARAIWVRPAAHQTIITHTLRGPLLTGLHRAQ